MKAGDRKKVGKFWYIRVICPVCGEGRQAKESLAKMPHFTGRCKKCYLDIARRELRLSVSRKGER